MTALNTGFDFVDLSSTIGLIATGVLTVNLLLGVLLSTKYKTTLLYQRLPLPLRRVSVFTLHNYAAYTGLALAALHPSLLLFAKQEHFAIQDILFPLLGAPHQRYLSSLGALAFYGLFAVVLTSTVRVRRWFSNRTWKWIHFLAYAAIPLFLVHGLLVDPKLTDKPVDLIDAEKVLSESGLVLFTLAVWFRLRYERRKRWNEAPSIISVSRVIPETAQTRSYVLDIPKDLRRRFAYRPGQFVTLRLRDGQSLLKRSYSISSSPDADSALQITIKRIPGGKISNYLADTIQEGDTLTVLPPEGSFFSTSLRVPHLYICFAAGSGITPVFSILKTVLMKSPKSRIALVYASRDEDSIIFNAALGELVVQHPAQFSVWHVLSQPQHLPARSSGRLDRSKIVSLLNEIEGVQAGIPSSLPREYYLCGPTPFMNLVEGVLQSREVAPERLHLEAFTMGAPQDQTGEERQIERSLEITGPDGSDRAEPQTVLITFRGITKKLAARPNETLLDAALRAGLTPPFACQQGECASCKASLQHGRVRMRHHEALNSLEIDQGTILTCQAVPVSEMVSVRFDQ